MYNVYTYLYLIAYRLNIYLLQDIYRQETFIYIHFSHFRYMFRIDRGNYWCEFCIYIVSFIIILTVCLVYYHCIGSLLIYVDRLLNLCPSRSTAAALGGRSAQLSNSDRLKFVYGWNILVCRRYTTEEIANIHIVWYFKCSSWFQGLLVLGEPDGWPGPLVSRWR